MGSLDTIDGPPLWREYELLRTAFSHRSFGCFPTPVTRFAASGGREDLYVKNDGVSGDPYGGNKVRKLEFLLADALRNKAKRVITCGAAGSNHALATAIYAARAGLKATLLLFDQPPSRAVCDNLLMDAQTGAELLYEERYAHMEARITRLLAHYEKQEGVRPYVIPAGGSSEVGVLGYVNAAVELGEQIRAGQLEEPATIVVPFGTMGTVAGLALGLAAAGIGSRVAAVRVVPFQVASMPMLVGLCNRTNELLRMGDPSFPRIETIADTVTVVDDYYAPGYGIASPIVEKAVRLAADRYGLNLDLTYSGKAFAAFHDAALARDRRGPLLFWYTKNAHSLPQEVVEGDYRVLPQPFHRYFTAGRTCGPVQDTGAP